MKSGRKEMFAAAKKIVLLAEDEPIVRSVLSMHLRRMGLDVLPVVDGVDAVKMFRLHAVNLVVLDCMMPRLNGFQAFKKIRSINPDIPVVALSGDDGQSVICRFGEEQPNEILIKPVLVATLRQAVFQWIPSPEETLKVSC